MNKNNNTQRLLSLDALRGFDMLFIMGLAGLIVNLAALAPDCAVANWFALQMKNPANQGNLLDGIQNPVDTVCILQGKGQAECFKHCRPPAKPR